MLLRNVRLILVGIIAAVQGFQRITSAAAVQSPTTWHVDVEAPGPAHDGTTWCSAFRDLQDALAAAQTGDQIQVAVGLYRPDRGTGDRLATFTLKSGVSVLGGYAGCGESNPSARDYSLYPTVLSGDLARNDGAAFANYSDNSYHVVTYNDPGATGVVLEGFTVSSGNANGSNGLTNQGGGIHIRQGLIKCLPGGPTIRDCIVEKNWGAHHGAINDHGLATVIEHCIIRDNHAGEEGGGLQIHSGSPTITNCTFLRNSSDGDGGGAWVGTDVDPTCSGPSTATFVNCVFDGNSAKLGGGMFMSLDAEPTISDCTFVRNTVVRDGGGMYCTTAGDATIQSCLFTQNSAISQGGGVYNARSNPTFTACIFRGNMAGLYAGAMRNLSNHPRLTECVFAGNFCAYNGGACHNRLSSPTYDRCAFFGNVATNDGGAIFNIEGSSPLLRSSVFSANKAQHIGGAIANHEGSLPELKNCTLRANSAVQSSGGIDNDSQSRAGLTNSIIWGQTGGTFGGAGLTTATYSDIEGGYVGEGNINSAPMFVDADGPDNTVGTEDDDLRLKRGSPGINVGNPEFQAALNEQDLAGGPRLVGCRVDMGAHESSSLQTPGDFNADRAVNLADFAKFQLCAFNPPEHAEWWETCLCVFDFDGSNFVDLADYAAFPWDLRVCDTAATCDDGDACNGVESCVTGMCQPGTPIECDDGNHCTDDACEAGLCVHVNNLLSCNDGNACTAADVCSGGVCTHLINLPPGTACGNPTPTGPCDRADICNGSGACVPNLSGGGTVCRASTGECDPAEVCSGTSATCPANAFTPDNTACTSDTNACTGDVCMGGACTHPNHPAGTVCRASVGGCDATEFCDGAGTCPADGFAPSTTQCRASAGICDPAEFCTGTSPTCPPDSSAPDDTPCSDDGKDCTDDVCMAGACTHSDLPAGTACGNQTATGPCDQADVCDGSGMCVSNPSPVSTVCRASVGDCDATEFCDGAGSCPADGFAPSTTLCRASTGECDPAEVCSGASPDCPPDTVTADGTACAPDTNDCTGDVCMSGACTHPNHPAGTACGNQNPTGACDQADVCNSSGMCVANFRIGGTVCRVSTGECDPAEFCTGLSGTCPADVLSTQQCRASTGDCDPPEFCTGSDPTCPPDVLSTAVCRPAADECDVAESCTGSDPACPPDAFVPDGTACGNQIPTGLCDQADICDASGMCVANLSPAGTLCRASINSTVCDPAELCTGTSVDCPPNLFAPDGTECDDDDPCTENDACDANGFCTGTNNCPP